MSRSKRAKQIELRFWRGSHLGEASRPGRRPGPNPRVRHESREGVVERFPCHVVLRVRRGISPLRSWRVVREIEASFRKACSRNGFRLVHYSIQDDRHLIVEAGDRERLACGMKSIAARFAFAVNRALRRSGPVLADRYHHEVLDLPAPGPECDRLRVAERAPPRGEAAREVAEAREEGARAAAQQRARRGVVRALVRRVEERRRAESRAAARTRTRTRGEGGEDVAPQRGLATSRPARSERDRAASGRPEPSGATPPPAAAPRRAPVVGTRCTGPAHPQPLTPPSGRPAGLRRARHSEARAPAPKVPVRAGRALRGPAQRPTAPRDGSRVLRPTHPRPLTLPKAITYLTHPASGSAMAARPASGAREPASLVPDLGRSQADGGAGPRRPLHRREQRRQVPCRVRRARQSGRVGPLYPRLERSPRRRPSLPYWHQSSAYTRTGSGHSMPCQKRRSSSARSG